MSTPYPYYVLDAEFFRALSLWVDRYVPQEEQASTLKRMYEFVLHHDVPVNRSLPEIRALAERS